MPLMKSKKCLSRNTIKWIAVLCMLIDHFAWAFLKTDSVLGMLCHTVGKVTAPCMFYFLAEGIYYTRSVRKYVMRLAIFAAVSELPYLIFANDGALLPLTFNVLVTMLCAVLAIYAYDRTMTNPLWAVVMAGAIMVTVSMDWGIWGVAFAVFFYRYRGNFRYQWLSYAAINLMKIFYTGYERGLNLYYLVPVVVSPVIVFCLFCLYNGSCGGSKGRKAVWNKWAFYVIYPLQFIVFDVIMWLLGR